MDDNEPYDITWIGSINFRIYDSSIQILDNITLYLNFGETKKT